MAESPITTPDEELAEKLGEWCHEAVGVLESQSSRVVLGWVEEGTYDDGGLETVAHVSFRFAAGVNRRDTVDNLRLALLEQVEALEEWKRVNTPGGSLESSLAAQQQRRASA